jgi:hypothetical protein
MRLFGDIGQQRRIEWQAGVSLRNAMSSSMNAQSLR